MNQIRSQDVARMAWNASLYSNQNSAARGRVLWILGPRGCRVVATDDYVVLVDTTEGAFNPGAQYLLMELKELKGLEKGLREDADGLYDLDLLPGDPLDVETVSELELYAADQLVAEAQTLNQAFELSTFAVAPDRLRNLARVKPGDYPIDLKIFSQETELLAFKIGPTVTGVIAPLDRDELSSQYTEKEMWL